MENCNECKQKNSAKGQFWLAALSIYVFFSTIYMSVHLIHLIADMIIAIF